MKGILGMLRPKAKAEPDEDRLDSVLFTTAFAGQGVDADLLVPWVRAPPRSVPHA